MKNYPNKPFTYLFSEIIRIGFSSKRGIKMIFTDKEYIDEKQLRKLKLQIIEIILLTELISISCDMGEMTVAYKLHWTLNTETKTLTVDYDGDNEKTINYGKNYSNILYDISSIIDPDDV